MDIQPLDTLIQKRTEGVQTYRFQFIKNYTPVNFDPTHKYQASFATDESLAKTIDLTINGDVLQFSSDQIKDLPAGRYRLEIWELIDDKIHAIYPHDAYMIFRVVENTRDLPQGTVSSLTLDEFTKKINKMLTNVTSGGQAVDLTDYYTKAEVDQKLPQVQINPTNRTVTVNGQSLTIPEPVDLTGLASKKDLVGLVKQTELAQYALKSDLDDYAKKSDIPASADLSVYVKKTDLPNLTNYATKTDLSDYATKDDVDQKVASLNQTGGSSTPASSGSTLPTITTEQGTFLLHTPTSFRTVDPNDSEPFFCFDNGSEMHFGNLGSDHQMISGQRNYWDANNGKIDGNGNIVNGLVWQYMLGNVGITIGDVRLLSQKSSQFANWSKCSVKYPYQDSAKYDFSNAHFTGTESDVTDGERNMIKTWFEVGLFSEHDILEACHVTKKGV